MRERPGPVEPPVPVAGDVIQQEPLAAVDERCRVGRHAVVCTTHGREVELAPAGAVPDASSSINGTTADTGIGREKNSERLTVRAAPCDSGPANDRFRSRRFRT